VKDRWEDIDDPLVIADILAFSMIRDCEEDKKTADTLGALYGSGGNREINRSLGG